MSKIQNYQANAIRTIYGHDTYIERDNVTNDEALEFFQKNMNFNKSIEIPDKINSMSQYHKLTTYAWAKEKNEERTEGLDNNTISKIGINRNVLLKNKHSYKLLGEKEINWESAYLPGLDFEDFDMNNIKYNMFNFSPNGQDSQLTMQSFEKSFNFDNYLPNDILNTYDLIKVIDYLLLRIKALYFLIEKVKAQRSIMQDYQKEISNNE